MLRLICRPRNDVESNDVQKKDETHMTPKLIRCDDGTVTETLRTGDCGAASEGAATASPDGMSSDCASGAAIVDVGGEVILSPEIPDGQNGLVTCPGGGQIALRSQQLCTAVSLSHLHDDCANDT